MPIQALPAIAAGVGGLLGYFDKRRQNKYREEDQDYIRGTRRMAGDQAQGILDNPNDFFLGPDQRSISEMAGEFHNPYQSQVIAGIQEQFGRLRDKTMLNQNAGATAAGAFGGSRHALQTGAALGELGAAETQQIGGLLHSDWRNSVNQGLQYSEYQRALRERQAQEPVWRANPGARTQTSGDGRADACPRWFRACCGDRYRNEYVRQPEWDVPGRRWWWGWRRWEPHVPGPDVSEHDAGVWCLTDGLARRLHVRSAHGAGGTSSPFSRPFPRL